MDTLAIVREASNVDAEKIIQSKTSQLTEMLGGNYRVTETGSYKWSFLQFSTFTIKLLNN